MIDKCITLNMGLASNEFAIGLATGFLAVFSMAMGGFLSFVAIAALLVALVFFVMGFIKLFYRSLFTNEAYLYMSLPFSNLQVILCKIFVGTFWLVLGIGVIIAFAMVPLQQSVNILGMITSSLLMKGIPAEKIGILMVILFWSYILATALFSSTLLFVIIFTNTLSGRNFKIPINIATFVATFAALQGVLYMINKSLDHAFDAFHNVLEIAILSLGVSLSLLALFIFLSVRLLNRKYNLN